MKIQYNTLSKKELIKLFQNKGACYHSITEANRILFALEQKLTDAECFALSVSRRHALGDEGRAEFDEVCNDILNDRIPVL
jgi:hypothetical protein